jgi:glycosyltransferase involved in cell wall biosynthesis
MYGFMLALMGGLYQFLSYAKYWEKKLEAYNAKGVVDTKNSNRALPIKDNTPGRRKISVVVLTKNEEEKIKNCLESLRWADEVVIVDGFSTDRTVDIAREYGAKVVQHKFEGDFGKERNIGVENSTGDWVLQLDADEVVTEGFRKKTIAMLKGDDKHAAYKFFRKNFFIGRFMRYGGWYHHSHHFFRKGFAHYDGKVHHQLVIDGEEGTLKADVEHYPFQSISQLISRQNRYTTIEARELFELRGKIDEKEVEFNIKKKPVKLFWKFYVKKKGFLEGVHGLVFSVLFAWVHFLKWAKYWEMCRTVGDR